MAPIARCWGVALKADPRLDLWAPDGNHSSRTGAFLAACGFYYWIAGASRTPTYVPPYLTKQAAARLRSYARQAMLGAPVG